jgi:hypothetical protein
MKQLKRICIVLLIAAVIPVLVGCKTSGSADMGTHAMKYTCPMHPELVVNSPGHCPTCGMALIEKH